MQSYATITLTVSALIWAVFNYIEGVASPKLKADTKRYLENIDIDNKFGRWPENFLSMFDVLFTKKHFSFKCFFRSLLFSFISVWLVFNAYYVSALGVENYLRGLAWVFSSLPAFMVQIQGVLFISFLAFVVNGLADYVSLLETRYLLFKARKSNTTRISKFILVDFLLSALIFCLVAPLTTILFIYLIDFAGLSLLFEESETEQKIELPEGVGFGDNSLYHLGVVFFASTFLTSVWLWFYLASVYMVTKASLFSRLWSVSIGYFFDLENKPFASLGFISCVLVLCVALGLFPLYFLLVL